MVNLRYAVARLVQQRAMENVVLQDRNAYFKQTEKELVLLTLTPVNNPSLLPYVLMEVAPLLPTCNV